MKGVGKEVKVTWKKGQAVAKRVHHVSAVPTTEIETENNTGPGSSARAQKSTESADDEIDLNRCCVCFGMFTDDIGTG